VNQMRKKIRGVQGIIGALIDQLNKTIKVKRMAEAVDERIHEIEKGIKGLTK